MIVFETLVRSLRHGYFSRAKQQVFLEDLGLLVNDGVPVNQALETILKVSEGIAQRVAASIIRSIAQGKQLADGMQGWFSRPIVEIIRAGEKGGTLAKTLKMAAHSIAHQNDALRSFLGALLYPLLVLIVSFVMLVFIRHFVLDNFIAIQPFALWPDVGKHLYWLGVVTQCWWWLAIVVVFALIYSCRWGLQKFTGDFRCSIDKLPLVSLYRDIAAARFMETLGLLISNGVVLKEALSIMQRDAAPYLSWHILKMEFSLSGGEENVADVLDTNLISHHNIIRLRTVAQCRGFEFALMSLGRQANARVAKEIVLTGKIMGGVLLMLVALIAATIVFGLYSVGSSITI